ncbi:MAG: hypothetical protein ACP5U0_10130 [Caldisphaera sp.]
MSVKVYGKILLLNGQIASSLTMGGKSINRSQMSGVTANISVSNGIVEIEYQDSIKEHLNKGGEFWLYYITKDLLDNFIFVKEAVMNKCLLFLPEYYVQDDTKTFFEDLVFADGTIVDEKMFIKLLAENPKFREGVRDYHTGLLDVQNCPTHFYRTIDSFKHLVMNKEETLTNPEFEEFQRRLGLTDNEKERLNKLYEMAKKYRHGVRTEPIKNYLELMFITKIIVLKTANYIETLNQQTPKQ